MQNNAIMNKPVQEMIQNPFPYSDIGLKILHTLMYSSACTQFLSSQCPIMTNHIFPYPVTCRYRSINLLTYNSTLQGSTPLLQE